jgi:3-(3-hydroxy-phenyl)propionate hydroxylase
MSAGFLLFRAGAFVARERLSKEDHVLVVGAGPVGLTAALALRSRGIAVSVLEADTAGRERPGSRAIFIHRESLAHFEGVHAGLGRAVAGEGIQWLGKRTFWGDREVFARTYPPPEPTALPHSTNLTQVRTEEILLAACHAAGVDLQWDCRVEKVEVTADGVILVTDDGRTYPAPYVVAADGARSAVRQALGIPLEGSRSESSFVIVDVDEDRDDPLPLERRYHYAHPAVGGRNVLLVPFAGGWRADLQCRRDDDPDQFGDGEGVRRWIGRVMPPRYADRVRWVSTYRFLQVLAREFVDPTGRVLLVGEAAHLFAPFGARGMNSGVADAVAAADAIQAALHGKGSGSSPVAPVVDFGARRRAAAEHNRRAAGLALDHMLARGPRTRMRRRAAAELARFSERAGAWLDAAPYGPKGGVNGAGGRY